MASSSRYQVLQNEEDEHDVPQSTDLNEVHQDIPSVPGSNVEATPPLDDSPPPYEPSQTESVNEAYSHEPPPLYTDVVKLPTYNESENVELEDEEEETPTQRSILLFFLNNDYYNTQDLNDDKIGSDVGFIFCFLLSFVFNWVGFLVAYCFTNSLSANYGAISGFGLSLVKWGFILKHSNMSKEYLTENPWLLYLFILLGWMVFLRGVFAYAQLKRFVYNRHRSEDSGNVMFG